MRRYPLQALHVLWKRREAAEAVRLAGALRAGTAARAHREEREVALAAAEARLAGAARPLAQGPAHGWQEASRFTARARAEGRRAGADLAGAITVVALAEAEVSSRRALLERAARERGALDRFRQAWRAAARRERERIMEAEREDVLAARR